MIQNISNGKVISRKKRECRSLLSKAIGLMFSPSMTSPLIFVFDREQRVSLHMIFVFFPIDVLWLDKNKTVVELLKGFRPFSAYTPKRKACFVIELPSGTIQKTATRRGDTISF